jgi:hypothetical protein
MISAEISGSSSQHSHDSDNNWDCNHDDNCNYDVDGQQRLIALIIMSQQVRKLCPEQHHSLKQNMET